MDVSADRRDRRLLLAGATGLVGGEFLHEWLGDAGVAGRLLLPVRRELPDLDARVSPFLVDFDRVGADGELASQMADQLGGAGLDAYVCALGTTLRKAGSREAFIAVDRDLVLRMARLARDLGASQALLVSSAGASRQSGNFYLRVKGEVEDALAAMGFERVDVLRPGLLLGARAERRPGEAVAQALAPVFNPLLLGRLRQYRAVDAIAVARALRRLVGQPAPGVFFHDSAAIEQLAAV